MTRSSEKEVSRSLSSSKTPASSQELLLSARRWARRLFDFQGLPRNLCCQMKGYFVRSLLPLLRRSQLGDTHLGQFPVELHVLPWRPLVGQNSCPVNGQNIWVSCRLRIGYMTCCGWVFAR